MFFLFCFRINENRMSMKSHNSLLDNVSLEESQNFDDYNENKSDLNVSSRTYVKVIANLN
jgi:hypothetical protein